MSGFSLMGHVWDVLQLLQASYDALGFEKVLSLTASFIFVGVFLLQFFSIYRHGGREAVVSMLTWVLVAGLCTVLAGYYWQQQRDFFQVVLLLILTVGALICVLMSYMARSTIAEEVVRRQMESTGAREISHDDEMDQAIVAMRDRLALARKRKEPVSG